MSDLRERTVPSCIPLLLRTWIFYVWRWFTTFLQNVPTVFMTHLCIHGINVCVVEKKNAHAYKEEILQQSPPKANYLPFHGINLWQKDSSSKILYMFCSKKIMNIIANMNIRSTKWITKIVKYKYAVHNFAFLVHIRCPATSHTQQGISLYCR